MLHNSPAIHRICTGRARITVSRNKAMFCFEVNNIPIPNKPFKKQVLLRSVSCSARSIDYQV
jgi:hypothetical protein